MKKVIYIFLVLCGITSSANAQMKKFVQSFTIGTISSADGATTQEEGRNLVFEKTFAPSLELSTTKSRHAIAYDLVYKNIFTVQSYLLPDESDAYFIFSNR